MPYVVSCTFREPVKTYFLDPCDFELHVNTLIVAHTDRGLELGKVKFLPREVGDDKIVPPLRAVERVASPEDIAVDAENRALEAEALQLIRERITFYGLPMKPIACEMLFDR